MLPTYKKLQKIVLQEQKLGYQNKAVIGGLERYANNWVGQALQEATTKEERLQIERIAAALKKYPDCETEAGRQETIKAILDELKTDFSDGKNQQEASPPTKDKPQRPSRDKPARKSPEKPRSRPAKPKGETTLEGLDAPVTRLPGIKENNAKKLNRLDIVTVGDLLTLYPRRYDDYRTLKTINQLTYGEEVTIIAQIWQASTRQVKGNRTIISCILSDGTATIEATWFNQPWLSRRLVTGKQVVVSGRVSQYLGRLVFQSPEWEFLDKAQIHTGRMVPVYPLTSGVTINWLRKLIKKTVDYWAPRLIDPLPETVQKSQDLLSINEAIEQIHFPDDEKMLESARRRLAFDELLLIQLGVLKQRRLWKAQEGVPLAFKQEIVDEFITELPFKLTSAQQKSLDQILADLQQPSPMSRLLQGDVGSGKTVVALAAMIAVVSGMGQAAMIAPTEILAEQHYKSIRNLLKESNFFNQVNIELLTGSTPAAKRGQILADLSSGTTQLLVGTHAIIQKDVILDNLQLAIVDEQHRFGVEQRAILRQKGSNPHMLVMSATPIPRSLALTLYGDLDLAIIDEMPAGRQEIKTHWLMPTERERAYHFLRAQIDKGRQAFIICPLVEESDKIEAKSAIEEHERLQNEIFPDLKLGLLHGRMRSREKEAVMVDFRDNQLHILVSTSVVEVGIDIPNASVIMIEGANRFGLAQLHQFRGRVGRGEHQSYCLLLADTTTPEAEARLSVMEKTNNGFELAEEDLKLRGPGDFFGTKQSGLPDLKMVKLSDTKLLDEAREVAKTIFDDDPNLEKPHHQMLAKNVNHFWTKLSDPS